MKQLAPVLAVFVVCAFGTLAYAKPIAPATVADKIACVGAAVNTREAAIAGDHATDAAAIATALSTRAAALKATYASATTEVAVKKGANAAWNAFQTTEKNADQTFQASQAAAWKNFYAARTLCQAGDFGDTSGSGEPIFTDNFNRPDGDIGNGWSVACAGSGASIAISNNSLASSGTNGGGCAYLRTDIVQTSGISTIIQFSGSSLVTDSANGRVGVKGTVSNSYFDLFNGYEAGWSANANLVRISDNGEDLARGTYQFKDSDTYELEADISAAPQNWMDVYVWDLTVGETKPTTPTLSFHNNGANYTPLASGNATYVNFSPNGTSPSNVYNYLYEIDSL